MRWPFCTFFCRSYRHCTLINNDLVFLIIFPRSLATLRIAERSADPSSPGGVVNASKISSDSFTLVCKIGCESKTPFAQIAVSTIFQDRGFEDRHFTVRKFFTFVFVNHQHRSPNYLSSAKQVPALLNQHNQVPITAIFIYLNLTACKLEVLSEATYNSIVLHPILYAWAGNYR
mgnify:CR=1 FL=1